MRNYRRHLYHLYHFLFPLLFLPILLISSATFKCSASAQDFIRLGKVGEWNYSYGDFRAVDVKEINGVTCAFCATSKGMAVYRIHYENMGQNKTKAEVFLISFVPLGYCTDIGVEGNRGFDEDLYAYITAGDKGLYIRNVTNPALSYHAGTCDTPGSAEGVAISGGYAFVADGENGLQIIDISDKEAPVIAGTCDTPGYAYRVAIAAIGSRDYAFVSNDRSGIQVIDISDKEAPVIVGSFDTPGYVYGVSIAAIGSGDYAFVADGGNGLQVIDISDPTEPLIVGSCDIPGYAEVTATIGYVRRVVISGNYAFVIYISGSHDYGDSIYVIDISNLTEPVIVGSCEIKGSSRGVALSGDYIFVANGLGGFQIIDISDKEGPMIIGSSNPPDSFKGVAMSGDYAIVADGGNGLHIIDISDKEGPVNAGTCDTPGYAYGVAIATIGSGEYAFVADLYGGLQIIDISNKEAPRIIGCCDTPGLAYGVAIAEIGSGDYAFVADGESGIQIIDISDPTGPFIVGSCDTPGSANGLAIIGDYVFVADGNSGLQVIHLKGNEYPVSFGAFDLTSIDTPGFAYGVSISGEYAFVADGIAGIQIIDISDPTELFIIGSCDTPGSARGLVITGDYAFVADHNRGIQIIDISDTTGPFIAGSCNTPGYTYGVAISTIGSGDYAFVADGENGLLRFKINIGPPPEGKGNLILVVGGNINYESLSCSYLSQQQTNTPMRKRENIIGNYDDTISCRQITQALANHVFNTFQRSGYEVYDIYYLNPEPLQDTDNDGIPNQLVVDDPYPARTGLMEIITQFPEDQYGNHLSNNGPLYIYLIGHAEEDRFLIMDNEVITARDLRDAIDRFRNGYMDKTGTYHPGTNRQVVVIMESAASGTFIDDLADPSITVITSTDDGASYIKPDFSDPNHISIPYNSFTKAFMDALGPSLDPGNIPEGPPETLQDRINYLLKEAFIAARDHLRQWAFDEGQPFAEQAPQMALPEVEFTSLSFVGYGFLGEGITPLNHFTIRSAQDIPYNLALVGYDADNTPSPLSEFMAFFSSDTTILDPENQGDIKIIYDLYGLGMRWYSIFPRKNGRVSLIASPAGESDPHHLLSARITIDVSINDPNNIMLDKRNEIIVNTPPKRQTLYREYINWSYFYGRKGCIYEIYAQDTSEYGHFIQLALYDPNIRPVQVDGHSLAGNDYLVFPCTRSGYYLLRVAPASPYPPESIEYILSVTDPSSCHQVPFEMNLPACWSMVSLPVIPDTLVLSDLFPEAAVVYSYKKESGYVRIKKEDDLEPGKGYWMLLNNSQNLEFTGQPVYEYHLSVSQDGWDMIGGCTYPARASSDSCTIDVIYEYVPGSGYQRLLATDHIEPGKGYWILCSDVSIPGQCGIRVEVEYP